MSKWSGVVGFAEGTSETSPGVHDEVIVERPFKGEYITDLRSSENTGEVVDGIRTNTKISFVADAYARDNFHNIRYAMHMGKRWKVTTADANTYPRVYLTLGGIYHGKTPSGTA